MPFSIKDFPWDIDALGESVREAWIGWAQTQPDPKPSWLEPWDLLTPEMREADIAIAASLLDIILSTLEAAGYSPVQQESKQEIYRRQFAKEMGEVM